MVIAHTEWADKRGISYLHTKSVESCGLKPVVTPKQVTIQVDNDVLEWFKDQGHGYQTQINALLRAYMKAHQAAQ